MAYAGIRRGRTFFFEKKDHDFGNRGLFFVSLTLIAAICGTDKTGGPFLKWFWFKINVWRKPMVFFSNETFVKCFV